MPLALRLPDLAATQRLGAALAASSRPGDAIALFGDLGAGKTELARALIRAACADPDLAVPSPTYTLVETYDAPAGPIWHMDLYRLNAPEEVHELGFEEALAACTLIEWPQRLGPLLPATRLDVELSLAPDGGDARLATLTPHGERWRGALDSLKTGLHDLLA